jgi:hypothetical protein
MSDRNAIFSATYSKLQEWPDGTKQYSSEIKLRSHAFYLFVQPNVKEDMLYVYMRCISASEVQLLALYISMLNARGEEIVIFRGVNLTLESTKAIGTKVNIKEANWSSLKGGSTEFIKEGQLTFLAHIILKE